eukprot:GHRR01012124.1.p1 GENE.GHRR01012124.1~~GHRR01012124.1.p1  ORF type:complete len:136 (+),score=18.20 GHRR01012124.1:92-499(+)
MSVLQCSNSRAAATRPVCSRRQIRVTASRLNNASLWTPASQIRMDVSSKSRQPMITCNQGPPPPNPLVVERFQNVVSQLFQQRIVRMGGPVDDDMANLLVAQLLYLDSVDQERDITMYVNSPGGSVTAGADWGLR